MLGPSARANRGAPLAATTRSHRVNVCAVRLGLLGVISKSCVEKLEREGADRCCTAEPATQNKIVVVALRGAAFAFAVAHQAVQIAAKIAHF